METIWLLESEIISHNMPIFSNKIIIFFLLFYGGYSK